MKSPPPAAGEVTRLLDGITRGEREAVDRLFPIVYDELRGLAHARVRRSFAPPTLDATGLVHEAYLKLAASGSIRAESRAHFLAIAGRAMRQVLVDRARSRNAAKRGGGALPVTLLDGPCGGEIDATEILALNEALEQLEPRQRQIVEARFFGGMEEREIAAALRISERTVRREWVKARAWMMKVLISEARTPSPAPEDPIAR
jgi:RNA polymerase sigma factor (TIGR02999 family)